MGIFERYLSIWVGLAMAMGVGLGLVVPQVFQAVAALEWAHVNLVVAVLSWLMVLPMMLKIDPKSLRDVGRKPKGLALTLVVNWWIKPFTMAALGVLFFGHFFAGMLPEAEAQQVIAGMILLGVAPCTAMVFVWSQLTEGDANYTLVQVSLNDLMLVFAFVPIAGLLLGVTDLTVPWGTLVASVLIFVVVPLAAGLLIQTDGISALAYGAAKVLRLPHSVAAPAAMIAASNFFELAVAVAISLFGLSCTAALTTVVGVLIEVPVMLSLVSFANRTRGYFPEDSDDSGTISA